jgi:hypothetical protein
MDKQIILTFNRKDAAIASDILNENGIGCSKWPVTFPPTPKTKYKFKILTEYYTAKKLFEVAIKIGLAIEKEKIIK